MFDGREIKLGLGLTIVGYIFGLGPFLAVLGGAFHALWVAPGKNFKEVSTNVRVLFLSKRFVFR